MSILVGCLRRLIDAPAKNELKGYKVTDVNRTRKFGIACKNFEDLKRKACLKFNYDNEAAEVNVFLLDGSLIDEDYFYTLQPQTTLILQRPGEKVLSDADLLYDTLRRVNIDFLTAGDKVSEFLSENLKAKVAVLNRVLNRDDSKTTLSKRDDHPEWFDGLETNYTTKEAFLHRRCQDRIRGYLYKTIDQIKSSDIYMNDPIARKNLLYIIAFFKMQLKEDHYFGFYFDRSRAKDCAKDEVDNRDSSDCYDHCPCKLSCLDDVTYYRLLTMRVLEDDVDGRKASQLRISQLESHDLDENQIPYSIQPQERKEQVAICDRKGEFKCSGLWNASECAYGGRHKINPYRSREELILFSTWNLDHKIEKSRTLIPQLLELSAQKKINQKDIMEYYDNLFTVKNLRLVHVVCHDKGMHK